MADVAELDIIIGAKIQGVEQGLKTVQKDIAQTAISANKLDSSLQKANTSIAKSTTNFTGLSRVIQDLPFGFIAISNNLEQLLPAAGALGLAFSALVSALTFAQIGFQAWSRSASGSSKAVEEATKANEEFKKSLRDAETGVLTNTLSLQAFVNIARDSTKPLQERNEALKEANKILGEHGEKLTLVNINTAAATKEINLFTQALIAQSLAAKYADKIADLLITQREAIKDITAAQKGLNAADKDAAILLKGNIAQRGVAQAALDLHNSALRKLTEATTDYKNVTKDLNDKSSEFNSLVEQSTNLFGQLGAKTKETKSNLETISKILSDLQKQLTFLDAKQLNEGIDESVEKIHAIEDAIQRLIKIKVDPKDQLIQKLFGDINDIQLPLTLKAFGDFIRKNPLPPLKAPIDFTVSDKLGGSTGESSQRAELLANVEKLLKSVHATIPVNLEFKSGKELNEIKKNIEDVIDKLNKGLQSTINNFQSDLFSSIGEGIGEALSGNGFGDLLSGVFGVLASALKELGATLIETGIALAAFKTAFKSLNPIVAIGAGIALEAFATILQNKISSIPKFAEGGLVTGPTLGIFGEAGPEVIFPLDKLQSFLRPNQQQVIVLTTEVSGDKLLLVHDRASRKRGRTQ